jgi:hypothetical protein
MDRQANIDNHNESAIAFVLANRGSALRGEEITGKRKRYEIR